MSHALHLITDGLTYRGDPMDIAVNYAILIAFAPLMFGRVGRGPAGTRSRRWLVCATQAGAVQVALWFGLHEVGVSVVWAALAGFGLCEWRTSRSTFDRIVSHQISAACLCACCGVVYYAVVAPPITTVAHCAAALTGVVTWTVVRMWR